MHVDLVEAGSFRPDQRRDRNGMWTDDGIPNRSGGVDGPAGPGARRQRPAADRLNLTGRINRPVPAGEIDWDADPEPAGIDLGPDDHIVASGRMATGNGVTDLNYAVIGGPHGRELWLDSTTATGETWDPASEWTARLDADQAAELRDRLASTADQARAALPGMLDRLDAIPEGASTSGFDDQLTPDTHIGDDFGSVHWSTSYDGVGEGRDPWVLDLHTSATARPDPEAGGSSLTPAEVRKLIKALGDLPLAEAQLAEAATVHTGAMIALIPTGNDAARLAVVNGEPAQELHCTLMYLGEAADIPDAARAAIFEAVAAAVTGLPPAEVDAFAASVFNPPGMAHRGDGKQRDTCIVLGLSGELLDDAHAVVTEAVTETAERQGVVLPEQHQPWTPHVTLIYTDEMERVIPLAERTGPITFDRVRIAFAGQHTDIPLEPIDLADLDALADLSEAAKSGNGERLKRYWTVGKGGRAIKWGKKGDFKRCVRQMHEHAPALEDPEGYCNVLHRRATGSAPGQGPHRESAPLAEADRDDAYAAAAAGLIVTWPVLSEPITTALAAGAMGLSGGAGAGLSALAVPQAALDATAAGLATRLEPVAAAAAASTVADAVSQGAAAEQVTPEADRLAELAAATVAMIAASLTATAIEAALAAPASAAEAVRSALTAAGTAHRGQVATRLRAALTGAEAEGRRAVFEAHPPLELVSVEEQDACGPCQEVAGTRYPTVAAALADYSGWGGYRACAGSPARCRGGLRGVWRRPVAESAAPGPVEMLLVEAGSFHLT